MSHVIRCYLQKINRVRGDFILELWSLVPICGLSLFSLSLVIVLSFGQKIGDELALSCILNKLFLADVSISVEINSSSEQYFSFFLF